MKAKLLKVRVYIPVMHERLFPDIHNNEFIIEKSDFSNLTLLVSKNRYCKSFYNEADERYIIERHRMVRIGTDIDGVALVMPEELYKER